MKLGASFADSIHTEKVIHRSYGDFGGKSGMFRLFLIPFFIGGFAVVLLGKLFMMQVASGEYYRNLSDSNRIRTTIIHAPRGIIFDRNGVPLVYNKPGYRETIDGKTVLLSQQEGLAKLAQGDKHLEIDSLREYPFSDAMVHVVGYIGQISASELHDPLYTNYQSGDLIGKMGIEQSFESILRGVDGKKLTEVDAMGKPVRTLGETDPVPGQNVTLTLDSSLQQIVFNAMKGVQKGAAIVTTPQGQILAMVSKPSFDPNMFTLGKDYHPTTHEDEYTSVSQVLLDGNGQPLLNRAIGGVYPPGSTFKLVTAAAGLETHTIDANYTVDDEGVLKIGNFSFANWYYTDYGKVEGKVDVVKAIKRSDDIFFYTLGSLLGVDKLSAEAEKFGLGHTLGIQLAGEAAGLVPTREWKQKTFGQEWYTGDDYHYGIGQGYLLTTPLRVNVWTQLIANGGTLYTPQIVKTQEPQIKATGLISQNTQDLIRTGMIEGCSPGGVAWPLFNFAVKNSHLKIDGKDFYTPEATSGADMVGVRLACKTGTAQQGGTHALPHAWLTLFAPAYNPQIVVTVLSEASGEGSNIAGPIAKEILTKYFEQEQ